MDKMLFYKKQKHFVSQRIAHLNNNKNYISIHTKSHASSLPGTTLKFSVGGWVVLKANLVLSFGPNWNCVLGLRLSLGPSWTKSIAFFPSATVCLTADDTSVTSWLHPRVYMIGGNIRAVWPLAHCTQLEATRKTEDFCATVLFWVLWWERLWMKGTIK